LRITAMGLPLSRVSIQASSSPWLSTASARASSAAARSAMGVRAQVVLAARAAATASSTSPALPSGSWVMTDSSPGWITGMDSFPARSSLPISICHGRST